MEEKHKAVDEEEYIYLEFFGNCSDSAATENSAI
jgi:hypothetical protein